MNLEKQIFVEHLQDLASRFERGIIVDEGEGSNAGDHAKLLRMIAAYIELK